VRAEDDDDDDLDSDDAPSAEAMVLTDSNFRDTVGGSKPVFVKFYAPWCGHCKRLAPVWDELQGKVGSTCIIGKVDATVERATGSAMKVRGYPTLALFANNKMYDYSGARDLESLAKFCTDFASASSGKKVPWEEGWFEMIWDYLSEFVQKIGQIVQFEPTILPICYFLGVATGVVMMLLLTPKPEVRYVRVKDGAPGPVEDDEDDDEDEGKPVEEKKTK